MIKKSYKDISGTSFHGSTISATLADLISILGPTHGTGDTQDKVQNEWDLELEDGTIFTVYDWKEYRRYTDTETIEWHIGGRSTSDTYRAQQALEEALAEGININEQQTKTNNMSNKPNLFQSVKSFMNSKKVGETFTTKEFHAAMEGIEQLTWWKKTSAGNYYRQDQYKGYLKRLGFVDNPSRGVWRLLCHIPAWLDSGHVNSALGYMYTVERITWTLDMATKTETNTPNADWKIIHTPYKGMTREEIVAKINDYIYHNGIVKMVEAPKVEVDHLAEYKTATAKLAKDLATEIIGDGKSPNVWFVTQSPYFMKYKDGYGESFLLDGYDAAEYSVMFGPFFSYKDACAQYDEIELEAYDGVGTVTIEDRKIGVVKEKFLEERITVDYAYNEIDDSKFYNNK
jgi:hypothetical protein